MKYREVILYKDYFEDFFKQQSRKVQDKIIKVLDILETVERVPITYLKYVKVQMDCLRLEFNLDLIFSGYFVVSTATNLWYYSVASKRRPRRHLQKKSTALLEL